jgi:hypothetical protein
VKTRFQSLPFKCNLQRYTEGLKVDQVGVIKVVESKLPTTSSLTHPSFKKDFNALALGRITPLHLLLLFIHFIYFIF